MSLYYFPELFDRQFEHIPRSFPQSLPRQDRLPAVPEQIRSLHRETEVCKTEVLRKNLRWYIKVCLFFISFKSRNVHNNYGSC